MFSSLDFKADFTPFFLLFVSIASEGTSIIQGTQGKISSCFVCLGVFSVVVRDTCRDILNT